MPCPCLRYPPFIHDWMYNMVVTNMAYICGGLWRLCEATCLYSLLEHLLIRLRGDHHIMRLYVSDLTHSDWVTHICVGKLDTIGSYNGLSHDRYQAITWPNDDVLSIRPLRTNFSEILFAIQTFTLRKKRLKLLSTKLVAILFWSQCVKHIFAAIV